MAELSAPEPGPFTFAPNATEDERLMLAGHAVARRLSSADPQWGRRARGPIVRLLYNPGTKAAWHLTVWDEAGAELERAGLTEDQLRAWGFGPLIERCRRSPWRAQTVTGWLEAPEA